MNTLHHILGQNKYLKKYFIFKFQILNFKFTNKTVGTGDKYCLTQLS